MSSATDTTSSETILRRIRGLLDQAERTPFPSEAESFAAKAAELMARHHVDTALLHRSRRQHGGAGVVEFDIELGRGQYVRARLALLGAVTDAYHCRLVTSSTPHGRIGHVVGHTTDVEQVSLMYTSLLVQATRAAAAEPTPKGHRGVTFRRGFMLGFAERVGERLAEQVRAATESADQRTGPSGDASGAPSAALVLADRRRTVDQWIHERYGRLGRLGRAAPVSVSGVDRGTRAGSRADLGGAAVGGGRPALDR